MAPRPRSLRDRLFARLVIHPDTGCLEWTGYRDEDGYGRICRGGRRGKIIATHNAMREVLGEPKLEGLEPDHLCRNKACANLDHIEMVTQLENIRRSKIKVAA